MVVVSPPIYSRFFRGKTAYAMGKVGMSVLTKGLAMDWQRQGRKDMAITSIWPAAAIESAATKKNKANEKELRKAVRSTLNPFHVLSMWADQRQKTIFSDCVLAMLRAPAEQVNGLLELDEDFLRATGVTDFSHYALVPGAQPRRIMPQELPDLTVAEQDDEGNRMDSNELRRSKM